MITIYEIKEAPKIPAVYAMMGGTPRTSYVAYVGIAKNLRTRLTQHLVRRDSSVTTGTSATVLNPDYVRNVRWWHREEFADRHVLEAAELVAFGILNPALRSRGKASDAAQALFAEPEFRERLEQEFRSHPDGELVLTNLDSALKRLSELEQRLSKLEAAVQQS
jgi:hypothetical protein